MTSRINKTLILRFRDLITDAGGTIAEHQSLLTSYKAVWWGWMMRQTELVPRKCLCEQNGFLRQNGSLEILLFDTGAETLYRCRMTKMAVAPAGMRIRSPEYYNRGRYPAWFCFTKIDTEDFVRNSLFLDDLPTLRNRTTHASFINESISDLQLLRSMDVTLWIVRERRNA